MSEEQDTYGTAPPEEGAGREARRMRDLACWVRGYAEQAAGTGGKAGRGGRAAAAALRADLEEIARRCAAALEAEG